jgi:glycolate oxidase iron-sulfur subunit
MSEAGIPGDAGKSAGLLTGCVMDAVYGSAHLATVQVLKHNGWTAWAPAAQGCCGALALHAGELEIAKTQARRNIAAFEPGGTAPIAVNSAGCGAAMKDYGKILEGDPVWRDRARAFSARVADVSELLARTELKAPGHAVPWRVAYDDPCHLVHAQKVRDPPRALLRRIPGLELVPLPEADWCCGGAGSFTLTQPAMSAQVLARKMGHVQACGAEVVASGNPGCLMQLASGIAERGLPIRVMHPIELLALAYESGARPLSRPRVAVSDKPR